MTLTELATKYCSDKLFNHSYIPIYETLFAGRKVRRFLEIGIGNEQLMRRFVPTYIHGSSLKMWEEYFPDATIYACDIKPETLINEGRIKSTLCDQSKGQDIKALLKFCEGPLDIVIDDGSHDTMHQIITANVILPTLLPGAIYIIEDVQQPEVIAQMLNAYIVHIPGTELTIHRFDKREDDTLVVITT